MADPQKFVTHELDETKLVRPAHLQPQIDAIVKKYPNARAFVRYIFNFFFLNLNNF